MDKIYLSLGSNIEPEIQNLKLAVKEINKLFLITITKISSIYKTEPVGYINQKKFFNMVLEIKTNLSPEKLLENLQKIENKLGRKRTIKWGPRTIDIDILLYNDTIIKTENLIIPHPELLNRNFILVPLIELDSLLKYPGKMFLLKDYYKKNIFKLEKQKIEFYNKWDFYE
jgi:2-amino-4-hydroxy-6-hydroxymethyldihydropteridine diphosphokinase